MGHDLETDRNLSERARGGDQVAWRAIYESTCDRLFGFLCYQIGDRQEARDVLQETYLQAFRRLDTYRGEAPLEAWLRAIALARAIDWRRGLLARLRRRAALPPPDDVDDPAIDGVHFDSERIALHRALQSLSPRQRAALLLREWEERSFEEIARLIGCAESTARVHHARARAAMRAALRGPEPAVAGTWEGQHP